MAINVNDLNNEKLEELLTVCKNMGPMTVLLIKETGEIIVAIAEKGYDASDYKAISEPFCIDNVAIEDCNKIIGRIKNGFVNGGIFSLEI